MRKVLFLFFIFKASFGQNIALKLDSLMQKNFPENQAGAALMVIKNGQILYKKGFGLANIETKEKISANTNFRMASVSKQFTAMCIMILEQQKKLSYEDNLLKFFPNWHKKIGSKIKIKHLLTHSSGILDYEGFIPENQTEQILDADVVKFLAKKDSIYFEVGTKFRYSNSGFCLLAQIVEKVSNLGYVQFVENHIFKPLGMNNSRIFEVGKTMPNRAMGNARNDKNELIFSDQSITSATKGDGCVYTSLNDYQKWANTLIINKLVNLKSHLKRISQSIDSTKNGYYGMGWFHAFGSKNSLELYHTGSTCGFSNVVKIVPKNGLVIAYFSNIADNHLAYNSIEEILKKYKIDESENDFQKILNLTR